MSETKFSTEIYSLQTSVPLCIVVTVFHSTFEMQVNIIQDFQSLLKLSWVMSPQQNQQQISKQLNSIFSQ